MVSGSSIVAGILYFSPFAICLITFRTIFPDLVLGSLFTMTAFLNDAKAPILLRMRLIQSEIMIS